jgi:hypothetical protein
LSPEAAALHWLITEAKDWALHIRVMAKARQYTLTALLEVPGSK